MTVRFSVFVVLSLCAHFAVAQSAACPPERAQKALQEAGQLRSWRAVYVSFVRYAPCDDGAVAEGYSDSVARLLADHWLKFRYLRELAGKHPAFKQFVLRHVNGSMYSGRAKSIEANARSHCPAHGKALCREIVERIESK